MTTATSPPPVLATVLTKLFHKRAVTFTFNGDLKLQRRKTRGAGREDDVESRFGVLVPMSVSEIEGLFGEELADHLFAESEDGRSHRFVFRGTARPKLKVENQIVNLWFDATPADNDADIQFGCKVVDFGFRAPSEDDETGGAVVEVVFACKYGERLTQQLVALYRVGKGRIMTALADPGMFDEDDDDDDDTEDADSK